VISPHQTHSSFPDVAEENIKAVAQLQHREAQKRSLVARLSDTVTSLAAREWTVAAHLALFVSWALVNTGRIPYVHPFDPFPFSFLTLLVALEAIFLSLLVLASQNRLTQEADRRAHLDLQINLLSEQEMTLVLRMLHEICEHLNLRTTTSSPTFQQLVKRTDVSQLADLLENRLSQDGQPADDHDTHRTPR